MSSRLGDLLQRRGDLNADQLDAGDRGPARARRRALDPPGQARLHQRGAAPLVPPAGVPAAGRRSARRWTSRARSCACDPARPGAEAPPDPDQPRRARRSRIAMADPSNLVAINEVKFLTGYDVKVAVAAPDARSSARSSATTTANANYDDVLSQLGNESVEVVTERRRDRPQGARARHRGGAGRPPRQRDPDRRDQEAGERHPRRAVREDAPRPLPHRRRALRDHAAAAAS